jgi:predicted kinase
MSTVIIVCGLSFAGKSTLARTISERYGYVEVDVDATKISLYGADIRDQDLGRSQWERIYRETDNQFKEHVINGASVIDASRHFSRAERDQTRNLAAQVKVPLVVVYIDTPESVARQRWLENRENPTRRDVTPEDFYAVISAMQPPTTDEAPLVFHYDEDVHEWLDRSEEYLELGKS